MKVCGVAVARLQEHSWAPTLSNDQKVNVGTVLSAPSPANGQLVGGKGPLPADTDRMGRRTRSSPRCRESRSHGEGVQCVPSPNVDHGGRW